MSDKKLNLVVLMGGPSAEHDVSLATGKVILSALDKEKYNPIPVVVPKDGQWTLPPETDVVFIVMHGAYGEDGTVQGFLESARVPYTGSGILASALAMDKLKSNEIFAFHGLKVPEYISFSKKEWAKNKSEITAEIKEKVSLPCVIKPSNCGSSVGIAIVKKIEDLENAVQSAFSYGDIVLAQKYISGTEVTCAILDESLGKESIALPPTQIIPKGSAFFDYRAKYTPGATEEITPPRLAQDIIKKIQENALKAHKILGCSGMSRTDMIVSGENILILETNTIPGMTETSLYPQAAAAVGISFPELLDKIILSAINKRGWCGVEFF
ncbi:MAG: Ddl: D-alanine-D-alanine ligase [Candidatus Nomurabacteria bacterium GW2011_GWB1_43_7]|uniref:D-alanine--D-alanine ligase n=1 Tax=Candidatus Nomurabacteria bacterium GW2011_GWB1_43_7 TaxID=1618747 RepID=A0A0G1I6K0_9BACT|nr:MAG: Ddl: D-alanine-D-alanine ligase [Candidatus Nomurabacteria bacterium GW2011_GWB1_43_7]